MPLFYLQANNCRTDNRVLLTMEPPPQHHSYPFNKTMSSEAPPWMSPSSSKPGQMPAISRQSDALSLDTIATALNELQHLSLSKRSFSVNVSDFGQVQCSGDNQTSSKNVIT